jgi:butyrate kinase
MEVEAMIHRGDAKARETYQAMAYQIAKEICAMAAVLSGDVDAVVLTGGLAASVMLVAWIADRVKFLGPVVVYPGENEMNALALGALRVLRGEDAAAEY